MSLVEDVQSLGLTPEQEDALWYVARRVADQNTKWGIQNHEDAVWLAIDAEELGEAAEACMPLTFTSGYRQSQALTLNGFREKMIAYGKDAKRAVEWFFSGHEKSRENPTQEPHELDLEIAQTAAVAVDWLACRWRNEL